jgi:spectinomycin phosphotransferase
MDDEDVLAWVREDFGIVLLRLERVDHGADAAARVWRGTAADGRTYAVKWTGGGTSAGLLVPALLTWSGVKGIAAPVQTRSAGLWSEREGRRLSLVPWVSDERALDTEMTEARWRSYGALLAGVHGTKADGVVADLLPRETYAHERWTSAAVRLTERLHGELTGDALVQSLVDEWRSASDRIAIVVEQTDALGRELAVEDVPFVLCHADPHRGNLLLTGDQAWLIDWDDAMFAPRERDLMFVLSNVLYFAPVTEEERAWFFAGYGPVDLDLRRIAYHQCVRTLEDAVDWAEQVLDPNDPERELALGIVRGVLSPNGLARSALALLRNLGRIEAVSH